MKQDRVHGIRSRLGGIVSDSDLLMLSYPSGARMNPAADTYPTKRKADSISHPLLEES